MNKEFRINSTYLKEVINFASSKCVGKVMKRFDLFANSDVLRKAVKEQIYENFRDLFDIIEAYNKGLDIDIWNFQTKKKIEGNNSVQ